MEEGRPQTTLIEQQKKISLTAVESVDEFSPGRSSSRCRAAAPLSRGRG